MPLPQYGPPFPASALLNQTAGFTQQTYAARVDLLHVLELLSTRLQDMEDRIIARIDTLGGMQFPIDMGFTQFPIDMETEECTAVDNSNPLAMGKAIAHLAVPAAITTNNNYVSAHDSTKHSTDVYEPCHSQSSLSPELLTSDRKTDRNGSQRSTMVKAEKKGTTDYRDVRRKVTFNAKARRAGTNYDGGECLSESAGMAKEGRRVFVQRWEARFDILIGCVVVLNCLAIGVQIDFDARGIDGGNFFDIVEYCCCAIFSFELLVRLCAYGRQMMTGDDRYWAIFDTVLVFSSWCDIGISVIFSAEAVTRKGDFIRKMIITTKMVRLLRLVRMLRLLSRIRVMIATIFSTLGSLFWLFVLFFAMIYVFALVITQGAIDFSREETDASADADLRFYWGNVLDSMYTLFMSTCGGVSWGEVALPIRHMGIAYFLFFCFYIFFVFFSVVNVVTGVFVDGAIQKANSDRGLMIENTLTYQKFTEQCMKDLLDEIDFDKSGCITKDEWNRALRNERLWSCMKALGVDADEDLWFILDRDGAQEMSIHEIVSGLSHLKGGASAIDMYSVMRKLDTLKDQLSTVTNLTHTDRLTKSDFPDSRLTK